MRPCDNRRRGSNAERAVEAMREELRYRRHGDPMLLAHVPLLERMTEAAPSWALGHLNLGIARAYQQRFDDAHLCFSRATELQAQPTPEWTQWSLRVAMARVTILRAQGRDDDALALAAEILGSKRYHHEIFTDMHSLRVITLFDLGRSSEALAASDAAIAFDRYNLQYRFWRALALANSGDREAAEETLRDADAFFVAAGRDVEPLASGFRGLGDALAEIHRAGDAEWFYALADREPPVPQA